MPLAGQVLLAAQVVLEVVLAVDAIYHSARRRGGVLAADANYQSALSI